MNFRNPIFRDSLYSDAKSAMSRSDLSESKELLLKVIMDKCKITYSDLHDISIVRSKLREENINEIVSEN